MKIEVLDYKGDRWLLTPVATRKGRRGLPEMWFFVWPGSPRRDKFPTIPIPVFTDWWL